MAIALIVAGGRGERLGSDVPKALVNVGGRPMLHWSVRAAQAVSAISMIVVALPGDYLNEAPRGTIGVVGGDSRSESVRSALRAAGDGEVVVVHDAARALVTAELFASAIIQFERSGADALVTAAPVTDTIKQVSIEGNLRVSATLDRSRLWAVQTPQVFHRPALEWALSASPDQLARATDDASLIEQGGGIVAVMPAPAENFKITTQLDLRVAEMLLSGRRGV
jgi:2-C-methyl-D-erythritol 4-phosphate cytidylyltransferase